LKTAWDKSGIAELAFGDLAFSPSAAQVSTPGNLIRRNILVPRDLQRLNIPPILRDADHLVEMAGVKSKPFTGKIDLRRAQILIENFR
jgi:hypothetical protein